jgi:hypothetical protein
MARQKRADAARKGSEQALALLGREVPQAIALLSSIVCDEGQKPELRMKAAESILDRVCGKPSSAAPAGAALEGEIAVRFEGDLEEWSR